MPSLLNRLRTDVHYFRKLAEIDGTSKHLATAESAHVSEDVVAMARKHPDRLAIIAGRQEWTYNQLGTRMDAFTRWAMANGFREKSCVALIMNNQPDYLAAWLGITRAGGTVALVNSNLVGRGLQHSIKIVGASAVLAAGSCCEEVDAIRDDLEKQSVGFFSLNTDQSVLTRRWHSVELGRYEGAVHKDQIPKRSPHDVALYIFTSGTTGLPKAARMTHARCLRMMRSFAPAAGIDHTDRVLVTLPLYHSTGGLCGVGAALGSGACLILESKFSASTFWARAQETQATTFVYIGELVRFLMNRPRSKDERASSISKAFGNGLRKEVWSEFAARTGITNVIEFYGSTEGNVSLINLDGRIGSIGRIPPFLRRLMPVRLIAFDHEAEEPIRDDDGRCIEVPPGEVGEAIGEIRAKLAFRFDGYNNEEESNRKILQDVFSEGDTWFRTGDLMRSDKRGYFEFVDRIGDTFRWKSENVSTGEVADTITTCAGVESANVYGVEIPGHDGRAGMAAITVASDFSIETFGKEVSARLPAYAQPVFVRVMEDEIVTGTFKQRKVELVAEGFDVTQISEPLFVWKEGGYRTLDDAEHADIADGGYR